MTLMHHRSPHRSQAPTARHVHRDVRIATLALTSALAALSLFACGTDAENEDPARDTTTDASNDAATNPRTSLGLALRFDRTVSPATATGCAGGINNPIPSYEAPPSSLRRMAITISNGDFNQTYNADLTAGEPVVIDDISPGTGYEISIFGAGDGNRKWFGRASNVTFTAKTKTFIDVLMTSTGISCPLTEMKRPRMFHTATELNDGTVLLVGGFDKARARPVPGDPRDGKIFQLAATNTAEIFDPRTGTYEYIDGDMDQPRALHTATLLPDGRVLIAGGTQQAFFYAYEAVDGPVQPIGAINSFIVYNPETRAFEKLNGSVVATRMNVSRAMHAATLVNYPALQDTEANFIVMLSGGIGAAQAAAGTPATACKKAENTFEIFGIYDGSPRMLQCSEPGNLLNQVRVGHTTVNIPRTDDAPQVWVWGGSRADALAEVYVAPSSPETARANPGRMNVLSDSQLQVLPQDRQPTVRYAHPLLLARSGQILFLGGFLPGNPPNLSDLVIASKSGTSTKLPVGIAFAGVALALDLSPVADGDVAIPRMVVTGGVTNPLTMQAASTVLLGDDSTGQFTPATGLLLTTPRAFHTATALRSGALLLTGGWTQPGEGTIHKTSELLNVSGL